MAESACPGMTEGGRRMPRLVLGLLIPLAQSSGGGESPSTAVTTVLVIAGLAGLITLLVMWDKARQRRYWGSADFSAEDDTQLIEAGEELENEEGLPMPHRYVEGMNGQIEVDDVWVRIHRKGFFGRTTQGMTGIAGRGVQIRLSDIVDIAISYPRFGVNGYIRFLTGRESPISVEEAAKDESCVIFRKKHQADVDMLREELKALLAGRSTWDWSRPLLSA